MTGIKLTIRTEIYNFANGNENREHSEKSVDDLDDFVIVDWFCIAVPFWLSINCLIFGNLEICWLYK